MFPLTFLPYHQSQAYFFQRSSILEYYLKTIFLMAFLEEESLLNNRIIICLTRVIWKLPTLVGYFRFRLAFSRSAAWVLKNRATQSCERSECVGLKNSSILWTLFELNWNWKLSWELWARPLLVNLLKGTTAWF